MPRPKKNGAGPPKTRSRFGCWPCKARKVKCGEEKPNCKNCQRQGETCDYSIRLNWAGRSRTKSDDCSTFTQLSPSTAGSSTIVFPSPDVFSGSSTPKLHNSSSIGSPNSARRHVRSRSTLGSIPSAGWSVDPVLFTDDMKRPAQSTYLTPSAHIGPISSVQTEGGANSHYPRSPWQYPSPTTALSSTGELDTIRGASSSFFSTRSANIDGLQINSQDTMENGSGGYIMSDDRSKRIRVDPSLGGGSRPPTASDDAPSKGQVISPPMISKSPGHQYQLSGQPLDTLLTTGSSTSDDTQSRFVWKTGSKRISADDGRRGSVPVSSLLIDTPLDTRSTIEKRRITVKESISTFFGYDTGNPDLDVDLNDDSNAIVGSPTIQSSAMVDGSLIDQTVAMAFEPGGYYARPVPIKIPRLLLPLPDQLLNNHMNLLYFHHFLNHTARILVPLDCPINPYRSVLPRMAVHDEDLLNLLLAYSACHRSRLLKHAEPETRIARYVKDVFPRLRSSFTNPSMITINNVATSIMLASLEIISPGAFGVQVQWHTHLAIAREMFIARASVLGRPNFDEETFFLARWFGYLDILGSLSRPILMEPLAFEKYWVEDPNESDEAIDCLLGCTRPCMRLLVRVAQLVKETEMTRLDSDRNIRPNWHPSYGIEQRAQQLLSALYSSCSVLGFTCTHGDPSITPVDDAMTDMKEIISTNKLYHWAGIIQILRRVYNYPKDSEEVKHAVEMVLKSLETIRNGSPAEACLLFPIFTAACETTDWEQKNKFTSRMSDVEEFGMKQVIQAKELMEKTWESGQPWVSLIREEFIG